MLCVNANFTKASIDCGASTVPTNDSEEEEEGCYETRVLKILCVDPREFPIMLLAAKQRLCQSCFHCWESGLRLLSQRYLHSKSVNYYELLGVKSSATSNEIKHAFFEKSKKVHPDSDPANPALHSQFVELNEAYRVLSKDQSRREYDLKLTQLYYQGQTFRSSSTHTTYKASMENTRYWAQFHQAHTQKMSAEQQQNCRRRNLYLVGYCIIAMLLSIGVHILFFRKLEDVHNTFMDEKDRVITEMYNESKERARVNGFKKQTEILRLKHQEYLKMYKINSGGEDK